MAYYESSNNIKGASMWNITQIYYIVDSWAKENDEKLTYNVRKRNGLLTLSELMAIKILFQKSKMIDFKYFVGVLSLLDKRAFKLPSYARLILWMQRIDKAMESFLISQTADPTQWNAVDSTALPLLKFKRKGKSYRFADIGHKTASDWFHGLKLHIIVNQNGEIVSFDITKGSTHDLSPLKTGLASFVHGILLADSGYVSKSLAKELELQGLFLIYKPRKSSTQLPESEAKLYKKRVRVEQTFSALKKCFNLNISGLRNENSIKTTIYAACAAFMLHKNNLA